MARFLAELSHGAGSDWVVSFPDLPGLLACGDDPESAVAQAEEALSLHLEGLGGAGQPPEAKSIDTHLTLSASAGGNPKSAYVVIMASPPKAPAVRVNITIDKNLLAAVDGAAAESGTTRSGFLAEAARRMIAR